MLRLVRPTAFRVGLLLVVLVVAAVVIGPILIHTDPNDQHLLDKLQTPSRTHWLGTDQYGRDLFIRLLVGGRTSLTSAALIVTGSMLIGLVAGLLATIPGLVGRVVTGVLDTLVALPSLVIALAVVGTLGVGVRNLVIAFIVVGWPFYGRLVRGFAIERNRRLDIVTARAMGIRRSRVLATHVAPATVRQLAVAAALDFGYTLAALAGFSYLGLGAEAPDAEWGLLLRDAQMFFTKAPWLLVGPGAAIAVTVLGTSLLAEHAHARGLAR